MTLTDEEYLIEELETEFSDDYFTVFRHCDNKFMVCQATASYVPIEHFKSAFESMPPLVEKYGIEKFIFDKRALRAFHQPSMEWYYVAWKKELLALGLSLHRKILPDEEWFKRCVEAGKADIIKKHPDLPLDKIDIQYFDTLQECIKH